MPCFAPEIKEAEEEGVEILILRNPIKFIGENGKLTKVQLIKMKLDKPDASGRRSPVPIEGSEYFEDVDFVVEAIGLQPSTSIFSSEVDLNKNGTIRVNAKDPSNFQIRLFLQAVMGVTGASTIIEAAGQGKRAAFYIDKFLNGLNPEDFEFGDKLQAVDKSKVLHRDNIKFANPVHETLRDANERVKDFEDVEKTFSEAEVKLSADRCLDCSNCRECHQCVSACPAEAIDFSQKDEVVVSEAKSVIVSTGFKLFKPENKPQYGYGKYPNVIDAMQMDRLIAPTRPFNNVLRPGDGKVPDKIAYVLCTGSRDSSIEHGMGCTH